MCTFSELPRYPSESVDEADGSPEFGGALRGACAVAQTTGELLFIATPLFALLWWIVCLPLLLVLILSTETRDKHRRDASQE